MVTRPVGHVAGITIRVVDLVVTVAAVAGAAAVSFAERGGGDVSLGFAKIDRGWLLGVGFLLLGIAALWGLLLRWRHEALEHENAGLLVALSDADAREQQAWSITTELLQAELELIQNDNGFWSDERVSFFVEDPSKTGLVLVARFSHMPRWNVEAARPPYGYGQGCLGRAWDEGKTVYVTDLPDPTHELEAWQARLEEEWSLNRDLTGSMTMRSRTIYARRFDGGMGERPIGVVLVESTRIPAADGGKPLPELTEGALDDYFATRERMITQLLKLAAKRHAALRPAVEDVTAGSRIRRAFAAITAALRNTLSIRAPRAG